MLIKTCFTILQTCVLRTQLHIDHQCANFLPSHIKLTLSVCPSPSPSHAKITCSHIVGGQPISLTAIFLVSLYSFVLFSSISVVCSQSHILFCYVYLSILLSVLSTTSLSVLSIFFFCYSIEENLPSLFNGSPLYSAPSIIIIINLTILFVVSSLNIGRCPYIHLLIVQLTSIPILLVVCGSTNGKLASSFSNYFICMCVCVCVCIITVTLPPYTTMPTAILLW